MFIRSRRGYQEVLESYRHPGTGRPTHRCIARWSSGRTLDAEIAVLERAYEATVEIMCRKPEELRDIVEMHLYLSAPAHRRALQCRLEPLREARDGLARVAARKPVQAYRRSVRRVGCRLA